MKKLILFLLSIFILYSCNNKPEKKISPPDQLEFKIQWSDYLKEYENSYNGVVKEEIISKTRKLFTNKKVSNWIGRVKEIKSYDNYAKVILYQMYNLEENSSALYYLDIGQNSEAYYFVRTLNENDTIRFSGTLEREMSITDNGMITEPELKFSCDKIFNYKNIKPLDNYYSTNSSSTNSSGSSYSSSSSKTCSWCNKSFSGTHYTHLGKMAPCQSSSSSTSIGKYCSMKCCSDARKSSCPTCY